MPTKTYTIMQILLILDVLQEMILYLDGIDYYVDIMEVVDVPIYFIKLIQIEVITKHKKVQEKHQQKV